MTEVKTRKQEFESAIATLSEYGFSKVLIKRTLKDILRVYNGNVGWPLIKENGYEVVIERLISDNGPRQRKSQRKDTVQQTRGHSEHVKEEKRRALDPDAGDRGGLDNGHPVAVDTNRGSSLPVTPTLGGHPVADIRKDKSLLAEDVENFDIHAHQRKSWTRGGLFPTPPWLRILNASKKGVPQKFSNLPALLKTLDKDSTKQAGVLEIHRINSLEFKIVKEEKIEYIGECLEKGHTNSCKAKVFKNEEMECIGKCAEERHFSAKTCNMSILESKPAIVKTQKLADLSHIQHAETCHTATWCSRQESNSEILKAQKLAEVSRTHVAETCSEIALHSQQELNLEVLKAQESVDAPHIQHDINYAVLDPTGIEERKGSTRQSRKQEEQQNQEAKRLKKELKAMRKNWDEGTSCKRSGPKLPGDLGSPKRPEGHTGPELPRELGSPKRFMPQEFYEESSEPVTAAQSKRPRTESAINKANSLQSTFEAAERLDIARMLAFKLTRRRDGGPNPMFSRLQKRKQAGAGASVPQNNDQESNRSQCGEALSDSWTEATLPQRPQHSSDLPPGCWDPSATCKSQAHSISDRVQDQSPAQESPKLPPGFEEPFVASPESPRLPPGFWKPCGRHTSQEHTSDGRDEDTRDSISSDESPRLPPGFSEPYDPISFQSSPTLPPGVWEPPDSDHDPGFEDCNSEERTSSRLSPDLPPGFWKSPDRAAGLSSPSANRTVWKRVTRSPEVSAKARQEGKECFGNQSKGIPPKQVFIANIPSGLEGAEQKLYDLVREILGGFKSVPISATLPRKIRVTEDHAFVEFCCEAMAGIFMDAYHANASVLRIDGEQLLAARSLHLMKADIQLGRAVADRLTGEMLDPRNVFYLGNVPPKWQNEGKLLSHISILLEGEYTLTSKTLSVYTIPHFSDVYVHISSSLLAETFFLRCLSDKEHLEKISASLFVCRHLAFLPRAAKLSLGS